MMHETAKTMMNVRVVMVTRLMTWMMSSLELMLLMMR